MQLVIEFCKCFRRNEQRFEDVPPAPHGINASKGSVHIVAVRGFVEYVIHNKTAIDFLNWTKGVYVPDETFFSSLNHNPQLRVPGSYLGMFDHLFTCCAFDILTSDKQCDFR